MGHIAELVVLWAVFGLVVALIAAAAGVIARAVGKRDWTNLSIAEGAFAFGAVLGFVAMLAYEMLWT